ncbi:MAG TPA: class I SAM-dependent methyltransferase [Gemmataceae bacterium]|nr:class I SAM-dependent methyltransferase [Gemmataceae bacterium]
MKARFLHQNNCRLCGSRNVELVVKLAPIPLTEKYTATNQVDADEDRYPLDIYMCAECGHVQLLDVIDSDVLWDNFTYHSGQTKGIVEHFDAVVESLVARYQPPPGSLIVDVGSNDGSLLRPFKQRGYRVLGIDPAKEIARKANEADIETLPELLTTDLARSIRAKHGPAAVVTAFNVFAHAEDMSDMTASIRLMLADQGIFQFEAQYLLDIIDKTLLGTIIHEHMSHHSVKPLKRFLERHGLEMIDVERVGIQRGSIIGTAQPAGGRRAVRPSVAEMLALEEERRLDSPETIKQFGVRLDQMKRQFASLIADWKSRGASIAAYGAARSGPTFIEQFGLGQAIQCIFDDHPQKVHKFSPGHQIPVVPTAELLKRMPDYVIILAWIHTKKIVADNRQYLERGGRFVTCCPDIRIIDANSNPADL